MERKTWKVVMDELDSWPVPITLMTHGAGEPLLYPDLYDLLCRARQASRVSVGFMTNGMLLDQDWASILVDLQVDWLALSIDGVLPDSNDYFRVNADLRTIEENVLGLIEEKKRRQSDNPRLSFNMVEYPEIVPQGEKYVKKWLPHAEVVRISTFRPIGSRRLWDGAPPAPFRPCPLLNNQLVVSFDGRLALCCEDINLEAPLGNLGHGSLKLIYNNSSRLLEYRHAHQGGKIENLPLCRDCDIWGGDVLLKQERIRLADMVVEKTLTPAFHAYRRLQ